MLDLDERSTSIASHPNGDLEELQELLLEAERGRLDKLEGDLNQLDNRIKNKVIDASVVAKVLPDAIRLRTISPQDQHLAEAISPVIMPAIRVAVATALQDMVRYMNRTLDHDLFWRRLTWRWEALSKRKPYWEVALSHTLKYRVEYVFLFFKEDGVHLGDVHHPEVAPFKPGHEDLVSSMFSAIQTAVQKFTRDEFQASEDASWKTSEMTDGTIVCIEQGPKAVLAAVVRGVPSPSLRPTFQDALRAIHVELNEALHNFRGDKQPFEAARPYLESCLLHEESDAESKTGSVHGSLSPALVVVLVLLLSALGWWVVTSYLDQQREDQEQLRWAHFLEKARGKPGIQITHTQTADGKNGKTIVYGLRDQLSDEPQKIAQEVGLSAEAIEFRLEPYHSLAPELLKRRTRERLDQLVQEIETYQLEFEAGSSSLTAESRVAIQPVIQKLREGDTLAQQLGERLRMEIHGNTTEEGPVELNQRLALARAQGILSALNVERFSSTDFLAVAEAVEPSAIGESQRSKVPRARRVSFHLTIYDSGLARPRP